MYDKNPFYLVIIVCAYFLTTQGARAPATMILTVERK